MNNLYIFRAELVNPPSEIMAIRSVCLMASILNLKGLVEVEPDAVDIYWKYFKQNYLTDWFQDFLKPEEVPCAIRIDIAPKFPLSIIVDRITLENQIGIIGQLQHLQKIS
jgi:hypothetical protein